jgi:hypothetical protein
MAEPFGTRGRAAAPRQTFTLNQTLGSTAMTMQGSHNKTLSQRFDAYQPTKSTAVWACAVAAAATMIVGFGWGGWVTGGTAATQAATAGDVARGELAAAICVERFNAAPDAAAKLVEFKAIGDSFKKRQFVETGGWATMPGQTAADRRAAEGCATALAA